MDYGVDAGDAEPEPTSVAREEADVVVAASTSAKLIPCRMKTCNFAAPTSTALFRSSC
jgi:hypothetical protein